MWRWEDVKVRRWDVKMRGEDVKTWRCEYVKMRWEDVKMRRCEHVKTYNRPPLLEEPFAQTLPGKSGPSPSVFTILVWNRALATVSCSFFRPLSGLRSETAETETLQRQPRTATLPEKNTRFCARECFQPWIHTFPIAHTSPLLDDVIDMMMWLTWWLRWWCGCHDGETASHWQSSVPRKFPN